MAEDIRARQWASQRGCYVHPNVALQLGDDGMGLYAQGKIETGEPIIKVPIECCVTTESAESALSDAGVAVSGLDPMTLLRLAVCLARQHACHAPWDAMAREWSRFDAIPSTWSPAMVDLLLTGTSIHTAVQAKQRALSKEGAALRKRAPIRNWSEADAIVRSRVMPLPDRGFALVPLLDYANHSDNANARWDVEMVTETAGRQYRCGIAEWLTAGLQTLTRQIPTLNTPELWSISLAHEGSPMQNKYVSTMVPTRAPANFSTRMALCHRAKSQERCVWAR